MGRSSCAGGWSWESKGRLMTYGCYSSSNPRSSNGGFSSLMHAIHLNEENRTDVLSGPVVKGIYLVVTTTGPLW